MKKLTAILIFSLIFSGAFSQKSVDALFNKYEGKNGFVTLTINGNLLKLFTSCNENNDDDFWPGDVTEVRILVQEEGDRSGINFYDYVRNDLNSSDYEEFMRIKNSEQDLRMLVRTEGNRFREFLLIGGGGENLLIQVKGNMTVQEARKFSSGIKKGNEIKLSINNGHKDKVTIFAEKQ